MTALPFSPRHAEPIAILGMSCRFPGGESLAEYWNLLQRGENAVREIPPERWNADEFFDPAPAAPGKTVTRRGAFLRSIADFDAQFFGISRREALRMDPQQRLALELVWEAFEDAGLVPARLAGSDTGVYFGFGVLEYSLAQLSAPRLIDAYTNTGYVPCMLANRVSYLFDFRGPSLSLDTACSSSLVALHQACQSLRAGETSMAVVGGVNLCVTPLTSIGMSKMFALSPRGQCRFLDAGADGYGRGEGGGVVILKRLADALADGDRIRAVVRGSAVNQDGRSNGLTAPNRSAQEAVLAAAYRRAGIASGEVDYVEAHGTGTLLGDPIEAQALGTVIGRGRDPSRPCRIGSVKTNIGHLEAAAGMAGLIKVVLMLEHRQLAPSLHFDRPNPFVKWDELALRVQTASEAWPHSGNPAVAGVSSFGFGGTNAHVVVQEAPPLPSEPAKRFPSPSLFVCSAKTPLALRELAQRYLDLLNREDCCGTIPLGQLCAQAASTRTHFPHRLAIVASDCQSLWDQLAAAASRAATSSAPATPLRPESMAIVAPGRGARLTPDAWSALMGWRGFQNAWNDCEAAFGRRLVPELAHTDIEAVFALEYALCRLWRSWGLSAGITCGFGIGEVVAAADAGELPLESAAGELRQVGPFEAIDAAVCGELLAELGEQDDPRIEGVLIIGSGDDWGPTSVGNGLRLWASWNTETTLVQDLSGTLGALYQQGLDVAWDQFYGVPSHRLTLPTYPFQRERFWLAAPLPLFPAGAKEARRACQRRPPLAKGDVVPDCVLIAGKGERLQLSSCLAERPVALIWLRGLWCPYSQSILRELQPVAVAARSLGGELLAIIPGTVSGGDSGDHLRLGIPLARDPRLAAAGRFHLAYELEPETQAVFREQFDIDLEALHEEPAWRLPMLACQLISTERRIVFAATRTDCVEPLPLDELLSEMGRFGGQRSARADRVENDADSMKS